MLRRVREMLLRQPRPRRFAALGLAAGIVAAALWAADARTPDRGPSVLELKLYDWRSARFADPRRADPDIVIVAIDNASLAALEPQLGRWPWSREAMALILDVLSRAGARAVALDVYFPERNAADPAGDEALAEQVRATGAVLGIDLPESAASSGGDTGRAAAWAWRASGPAAGALAESRGMLAPYAELAAVAEHAGSVHWIPDADGMTRAYEIARRREGAVYPALALALLAAAESQPRTIEVTAEHVRTLDRVVPTAGGPGRVLPRWRGPAGTYDQVSAAKLFAYAELVDSGRGNLPEARELAERLRGKLVLVGLTATGAQGGDLLTAPTAELVSGVEWHATALDSLRNGDAVRRAPAAAALLAMLLLPAIAGWCAGLARAPWTGPAAAAALVCAYDGAALRFFAARGLWVEMLYPTAAIAAAALAVAVVRYTTEGRDARRLQAIMARYVSPRVLSHLLADPRKVELGGERRDISVLFSDIRGFTTISESMSPERIVELLNEYLREMVDVVFDHDGTLDKFIGDAVMAFWGAPDDQPDHARRAVAAALEMQVRTAAMRERWILEGKPAIAIGVGINSGEAVVGNIGSDRGQGYTAIGDTVNLASRLESLNKELGTGILVSEETWSQLGGTVAGEFAGEVHVKGKAKAVRVYALRGERPEDESSVLGSQV